MKDLSIQDIKELMEAFHRNKLGSLKIEQEGLTLRFEDRKVEQVAAPAVAQMVPLAAAPAESAPAAEARHEGSAVTSPIVGTFYASPAPDKDPFVRVGSKVQKGDVLFIIESMKLMNEITSEYDGVVSEIVVENAQGVEYGQPILYIQ